MKKWIILMGMLGAYLFVGVGWTLLARKLAPGLIQEVHANGASFLPAPWVLLIQRRSLESALEHWHTRADGVTWALAAHAALTAVLLCRQCYTSPSIHSRLNRSVWVVTLCFLLLACIAGTRHDYWSYTKMWEDILAGRDPWGGSVEGFTFNAYGPLFNALALPAAVATLLPKILFCLWVWAFSAFASCGAYRFAMRAWPRWSLS